MRDFPVDFLWGAATAAHQVEGQNINNDWWAWEHNPASGVVEPSGDAIDQWHRYPEDFALLASLGHNAHRISLEWSRIEPVPGEFSRAALDHYARVLDRLYDNGLTPFVTLHHFTLPQWFAERGGWRLPDALELFGSYASKVAHALGDRIVFAGTINEPQIVATAAYLLGQFPPGHRDLGEAQEVNRTLAAAHRVAVTALRAGSGQPKVGTCLQLPPIHPVTEHDELAAAVVRDLAWTTHLDDLRAGGDVGDWVGLQYYTRLRIQASDTGMLAPPPPGAETTLMGWEIYPEGFGVVLRELATVELPIYVTENGIATDDDAQRVRFLRSHLAELAAALRDGVDVRGYLHWSAFDNFEWAHGYRPTFGLVGIDRQDGFRRFVRPSAQAYARVARTGLLSELDAP